MIVLEMRNPLVQCTCVGCTKSFFTRWSETTTLPESGELLVGFCNECREVVETKTKPPKVLHPGSILLKKVSIVPE